MRIWVRRGQKNADTQMKDPRFAREFFNGVLGAIINVLTGVFNHLDIGRYNADGSHVWPRFRRRQVPNVLRKKLRRSGVIALSQKIGFANRGR